MKRAIVFPLVQGLTIFFALMLLCFMQGFVFADRFEFKQNTGDKYRTVATTRQEVWVNGRLNHRSEILNKISVEVLNADSASGQAKIAAVFQMAEKANRNDDAFTWASDYNSEFTRSRLGNILIDRRYSMPEVRNVPVFPDRELSPGDAWIEEGIEVHDLSESFGISQPIRVPFKAFYKYEGEREWKGKSYPVVSINYTITHRTANSAGSKPATAATAAPELARMSGKAEELIYWDLEAGQPVASDEKFTLTFELADRTKIEFRSQGHSELIEAQRMNRPDIAGQIQEEIARLGIKDATVKVVDEGVTISLDNIQFEPDSARLLPSETAKLDRIGAILKKYQGRDIMVAGHTALAGNAADRQRLSTQRAAAVADYLVKENVRPADQIMAHGFGADRPIADNTTETGRIKNRRVEITILEN
jgi:outer membrane protein OmpA-like peptidoglycan-associated protein